MLRLNWVDRVSNMVVLWGIEKNIRDSRLYKLGRIFYSDTLYGTENPLKPAYVANYKGFRQFLFEM